MSRNKFVNGWLLPKGINVEPTSVLVPDDAKGIATIIGCTLVDVIYNVVGDDESNEMQICGYVDDEGLLKPHSIEDVNHLAMFLLNYKNPIIGDVVVVGAPEDSEFDRDLPEWLTSLKDEFTQTAAESYNQSMGLTLMIVQAVEDGIIDYGEMQESIRLDEPDETFHDIARVAFKYAEMKESSNAEELDIVSGFENFLKEDS
tara:strand:- start:12032 stop:12637 length:606 start_codon:yes stop_codon:yes gene_type:complete